MCKLPFKVSVQKSMQNCIAKVVQSAFSYKDYKRAIQCLNLITGSRSKYRFSLV